MVKYTLTYFTTRGRAEVARLLFALGGIEYEDKRIEREDWPALKPDAPLGQLPILEIDGEKLAQSMAISRHLAREISAYGSNRLEEARIDVILETIEEFVILLARVRHARDDRDKENAFQAVKDKTPVVLKFFEETLSKSTSGFFVGDKVSVADIAVYHYLDLFSTKGNNPELYAELHKHKKIIEHQKKIANLPKIKEYIASRPETPF